jgi:RNA polymerase sigma factor (sigma-70 family)
MAVWTCRAIGHTRGTGTTVQPGGAVVVASRARAAPVEAVIERVDGIEADYTAFFRAEFPAVLRTLTLIMRDPARAEELSQDAFVQLLRHWPKVAGYDQPHAWVRRVAIRLAMRAVRRRRLISIVRLDMLSVAAAPAASRIDLSDAIGRLSGAQRAAIVLHYFEDRPVADVAAMLGCAEATARVHLHRGRNRLRELIGEGRDEL